MITIIIIIIIIIINTLTNDTCVLIVLTVALSETSVWTLVKTGLVTKTVDVIQPDRPGALEEGRPLHSFPP